MNWLDRTLYGNALAGWLLAFGIAFGTALFLLAMRRLLAQRLRTPTDTDAVLLHDLLAAG